MATMKDSAMAYQNTSSGYSPIFSPTRPGFTLPLSIPVFIPHRTRRKLRSWIRSRQSPTSTLTSLETSYSPADTVKALRNHKWTYYDLQYIFLFCLALFSVFMIPQGPLLKVAVSTFLFTALLLPVTRQFFLPFLPVATWLVFFYACGFIPSTWRPGIWVRVLPALENIFYGAKLSTILSAHQNTLLDIMAWLPYGIIHFGAPVVCAMVLFVFGPPGTVPVFARAFGYVNIIGVIIQFLVPCAPPWYENMYGLTPANYSIPGSPAGLARLDQLFGFDMYTSKFTASPMVFGAFPSLHSGWATIEALFMSHFFPRFQGFFILYTMWLWWATMYLSHHYAVDLVGGSLLSAIVFYIAKANFLPRRQADKTFRWDYDYVEIGESDDNYAMSVAEFILPPTEKEAATGTSTAFSPRAHSPVDDEKQSTWDSETVHSDDSSVEI